MFEKVQSAPPDPILGLTEAFRGDPNPEKINLSVGVYKDASGNTPILECVKEAEKRLLAEESSKGYRPIDGSPQFAAHVLRLLFAPGHPVIESGRAVSAHTPGGTGALRVAGDYLHTVHPQATLWLSEPTWANHPQVFKAAGVNLKTYPYFDAASNALDFASLKSALESIPTGDVVLLHGCCHNPTGVDPSVDQWHEIAAILKARGVTPLVDFAYQGFAEDLAADAAGLRAIAETVPEFLVASSFSKNFGLYNERVGALSVVAGDSSAAGSVLSQIKVRIRANYSNPPAHGGSIVTTVLDDAQLRAQWEEELAAMRSRINGMRSLLVERLAAAGVPGDYAFITAQKGMFSFSGLTKDQVQRLRDEHAIYIVGSGRINVAGITEANIDRLASAIKAVS